MLFLLVIWFVCCSELECDPGRGNYKEMLFNVWNKRVAGWASVVQETKVPIYSRPLWLCEWHTPKWARNAVSAAVESPPETPPAVVPVPDNGPRFGMYS